METHDDKERIFCHHWSTANTHDSFPVPRVLKEANVLNIFFYLIPPLNDFLA